MKCPHCKKDISEREVLAEAARINGRRGRRRDPGRQCPRCGAFLRSDGTCGRCGCGQSNNEGRRR